MSIPCYIFDIDGTLADLTHRLHFIQRAKSKDKDWDAFKAACVKDTPIKHMVRLLRTLVSGDEDAFIILMSGRNEHQREDTHRWLLKHRVPYNDMYMRADGDYRDDSIVKYELLQEVIADGYQPIMAFDDRQRVVDMWRANGVPCAQVAEGNF